jgi:hypothetical protein
MILFEMKSKIYLKKLRKNVYNIFVNGEVISENVLKSDVSSKVKIIEEYYNDLKERAIITVVLNTPEAIA